MIEEYINFQDKLDRFTYQDQQLDFHIKIGDTTATISQFANKSVIHGAHITYGQNGDTDT